MNNSSTPAGSAVSVGWWSEVISGGTGSRSATGAAGCGEAPGKEGGDAPWVASPQPSGSQPGPRVNDQSTLAARKLHHGCTRGIDLHRCCGRDHYNHPIKWSHRSVGYGSVRHTWRTASALGGGMARQRHGMAARRAALGYTQERFSGRGRAHSTVWRWETGRTVSGRSAMTGGPALPRPVLHSDRPSQARWGGEEAHK